MKLSIVISVYNAETYIRETLKPVIEQTVKQFQLVIVDDGSTDTTRRLLREMLSGSKKLDYKIIAKGNGGVSSARNAGLAEAAGEYVMFMDGDDFISVDLVEKLCETLDSLTCGPDVVCWGFNTTDERGTVLKDYFGEFDRIKRDMTGIEALQNIYIHRTMWICTGSAAFRKDFLTKNDLTYTEGCINGEDQEFTIKALLKTRNLSFINEILFSYVQRKGSVSNRFDIRKFDVIGAMKRSCDDLQHGSEEMKEIAETILGQRLVENYFCSLDSNLDGLAGKHLIRLLNENYPGVNAEIKEWMKRYRGRKSKTRLKCRLYLISPELYTGLVFIKRCVKTKLVGGER